MVTAFRAKRTVLCKGFIDVATDFLVIPKFYDHPSSATPKK
jgi:hypothetical protein